MTPDQEGFDFLCPYKKALLRPDEVAHCLGRKRQHVYDMVEEGRLEAHCPPGRVQERKMITRRSVLLLLAETANYEPNHFMSRVEALLPLLSKEQLTRLIVTATQRRAAL